MTLHPIPKPEPKEKKPRSRLQAKKRIERKTPVKKRNKERLAKRVRSYQKYMRSPEWKARRLVALIRADYACERCKYSQPAGTEVMADIIEPLTLTVHHKTYRRMGCELDTDLEVLCSDCHTAEHASRAIKPMFLRAG
jgi:5-methylcytosine-specific restriction endonuclease McrA